jgi:hypothetical protein
MKSASSLLGNGSSKVIQNPDDKNPMSNPMIPVKGNTAPYSKFSKPSHNIKLKSQYYKQMMLGNSIKNGGTYTLGSNSKGLNIFQDYDRAIDANMMRRRNPENNKQTIPNDYWTGSYDAYYSIPEVTNPVTKIDTGADPLIKRLNQQVGYKNQFQPSTTDNAGYKDPLSLKAPVDPLLRVGINPIDPLKPSGWMNDLHPSDNTKLGIKSFSNVNQLSGIGTDPTEDPDYIKINNELIEDRRKSELQRNRMLNQRSKQKENKYGTPAIRSGTKRAIPKFTRGPVYTASL